MSDVSQILPYVILYSGFAAYIVAACMKHAHDTECESAVRHPDRQGEA